MGFASFLNDFGQSRLIALPAEKFILLIVKLLSRVAAGDRDFSQLSAGSAQIEHQGLALR
jgi:hypothetical protein